MTYLRSVSRLIIVLLNLAKGPAFVVVVSLGLLSLLTSTSLPWQLPFKPFLVTSGSMRPTIPEGSIVFVDRKTGEVNIGDIVTFLRPGNARENVTHRITATETKDNITLYKTKGDANEAVDIWSVRREAMWGKVLFHIPLLGFVVSFTKTRVGVVLMVVLPLSVIAIDELRVIIREILRIRKKKSKNQNPPAASTIALFLLISYGLFAVNIQQTISGFSDTTSTTDQQISTSCWIAPTAPTLTSPTDNFSTNASDVTFIWNSTTSSCPTAAIEYNFQIFSDIGMTTLVAQSGYSASLTYTYTSIPTGEYWWRTQARDQYGNASSASANHLIVDRTAPSASLSVTGSWLKEIKETVNNGNFASGDTTGWATAGNVQVLASDSITNPTTTITPPTGSTYMARIGNPDDPGKYVWENRLMQSLDSGAKSLSLRYNFFSRDNGYDIPGFFIRLNGQEIFRKNDLGSDLVNAANTGWRQFMYDLSGHTDPKVNLALYAGNTGDTTVQSWVYIADVTTYFVSAPSHGTYTITGTDTGGAGISHYEYQIDGGAWTTGDTFSVPTGGVHTIGYRSVDNAGNSFTATVKLITDTTTPSAIVDLSATTNENTATLSWTASGNDDGTPPTGRAASYDIRYEKMNPAATDCTGFNFDLASIVLKPPSPQTYNTPETLEILGLDPGSNYCFALKSSDEAPNTSSISNIFFATTATGAAVNPGDVVINELMWMGSSVSPADEWLELRNMTTRTIDLTGLTLTKLNNGSDATMAINLTGKTIAPNGYFLIANGNSYAAGDSRLKNTITPNIWDSSLDLDNTTLQIKLMNGGTVIDVAWDGTTPTEGLYDTTPGNEKYYSMERISTPNNGANPLEWYTAIDAASTNDFFDGGVDERGTPGAVNRSENEPLAHQTIRLHPIAQITPAPVPAIATASASLGTELATPSAQETPKESTPASTLSAEITAPSTPSAQATTNPQSSPTATPEPAPALTPIPSDTPTPLPTIQPTPEPTNTPQPSPTQPIEPTPTPLTGTL